jgi:hypothetical protein
MRGRRALLTLNFLAAACGNAADVAGRSTPPPEPSPSPSVVVGAFFDELPPTDLPEAGWLVGGGPRVDGRGVLLPPGGPLLVGVPDAAHDTSGSLEVTVWEVSDDGTRVQRVDDGLLNAGPEGAHELRVPVSDQEGSKYEVHAELRQDEGGRTAVWRDWAVVAPQVVAASLELSSDRVPPGGRLEATVVNRGTVTLEYGLRYELARWDGEQWQPVELPGPWPAVAFTAEPASRGEPREIEVPARPGTYRLVKELTPATEQADAVRVPAQFHVSDA